jgi:hypothetical protein
VLKKGGCEGFKAFGSVRDPKGRGRIVIKRIIAGSPSREEVIIESICHQLISLDYSFSCRSDCIFRPVARVVVANFQLSREWCCLHHLIEKEQSFSITEASFAAAWQVPAAGMLTAR